MAKAEKKNIVVKETKAKALKTKQKKPTQQVESVKSSGIQKNTLKPRACAK